MSLENKPEVVRSGPMHLRNTVLTSAAIGVAAILAMLGAWWASSAIESRSAAAVRSKLVETGVQWAAVEANGLQVRLTGTAPNEAARFRVVNLAGSVVESSRVRDELEVAAMQSVEAPRFSVEMLRNDDGISLIGLLPGKSVAADLSEAVAALAKGIPVSDMLETADYPAPVGWTPALEFGLAALNLLPRSKISVAADQVTITAISSSAEEKRNLESDLARRAPDGLDVKIDISAPRPVLTPFTLRFVLDEEGARFDACSADTIKARDRILAAGSAAGVASRTPCTIGLGVPTPRWAEAAEQSINAIKELGAGSITFSDADLSLVASPDTDQALFDRVIGDLQAQLPPVFSLQSTLPPKPSAQPKGPSEFTAVLDETGKVQLRGRLTDEVLREAVDSYAKASFGADRVYTATRLDEELPDGWPVRVLAGVESLALLHHGNLVVRADLVEIGGVTGKPDGRARISQILSDKLGQGKNFRINVSYDEKFDPLAALPTPQECADDLNKIMALQKITFSPGSAEIDDTARSVIDALAEVLGSCPPLEMEIAGHTDSQGSEGGNRALSQARAEAVLTALQGRRLRVEAFVPKGYGEDNPIADNKTEAGREANRRIEFILLSEPEVVQPPSPIEAAEAALAATQAEAAEKQSETDKTDAPASDESAPATEQDQTAETKTKTNSPAVRGIAVDGTEIFVFEPSDELSPRPRRSPKSQP